MTRDTRDPIAIIHDLEQRLKTATAERDILSQRDSALRTETNIATLKGDAARLARAQEESDSVQKQTRELNAAIEEGEERLQAVKAEHGGKEDARLRADLKTHADKLQSGIDRFFSKLGELRDDYAGLLETAGRCGVAFNALEKVSATFGTPYSPLDFRVIAQDRTGIRDELRRLLAQQSAEKQVFWKNLLNDLKQ